MAASTDTDYCSPQAKVLVEDARNGILKYVQRKWIGIRAVRGFDDLEPWCLKELSDGPLSSSTAARPTLTTASSYRDRSLRRGPAGRCSSARQHCRSYPAAQPGSKRYHQGDSSGEASSNSSQSINSSHRRHREHGHDDSHSSAFHDEHCFADDGCDHDIASIEHSLDFSGLHCSSSISTSYEWTERDRCSQLVGQRKGSSRRSQRRLDRSPTAFDISYSSNPATNCSPFAIFSLRRPFRYLSSTAPSFSLLDSSSRNYVKTANYIDPLFQYLAEVYRATCSPSKISYRLDVRSSSCKSERKPSTECRSLKTA